MPVPFPSRILGTMSPVPSNWPPLLAGEVQRPGHTPRGLCSFPLMAQGPLPKSGKRRNCQRPALFLGAPARRLGYKDGVTRQSDWEL